MATAQAPSSKADPPCPSPAVSPSREWILLAAILCVAAAVRLWDLGGAPPGLTHDEAAHGQDAIAIVDGARPIYQTVGYGREPLYDYAVAAVMRVSGRTDYLGLRTASVVSGLATIITTYLWVRRAFGPREALLTCAWLAGSFWGVSSSRQGLRSVVMPALLAAAVYAWWRGAYDTYGRRSSWSWFALGGLFVGATLWTYMAARATWLLFLVLPAYLVIVDRSRLWERWPGMLVTILVAGAVAAPMFVWLRQHPGAEQRFSQLGQPLRLLATGDVRQILANSVGALGMFSLRADDLALYNIPGRPWLGPVQSALFYAGLVLALWRWRRPRHAVSLLWLGIGLSPSLVTGVSASSTRAIALLPVLYLFPAVAATSVLEWVRSRWRRVWSVAAAALVALVAVDAVQTCYDYFHVWAQDRDVRVAYHTTLAEITHYLDEPAIPSTAVVVQSSIYPGRFHDPYAQELLLLRDDLSYRWVDGWGALIFPLDQGDSVRLIVPALAPLDAALRGALDPAFSALVETRYLRTDDLSPSFDVYEWDSVAALEACLAAVAGHPAAWGDGQALDLPADLGHTVELVGYDLSSEDVEPGGEITLVTYWRILAAPDPGLDSVLFAHLLSLDGAPPVIAQQDRLDAPAWNWHLGETFAQVHRLRVGEDIPAGLYPLEVGAYSRRLPSPQEPDPPVTRWPLYVAGNAVSDRILLQPVEVKGQTDQ